MLDTKCNPNVGSTINTTIKSDTFGSSYENENNCEYPIIEVVDVNNTDTLHYDILESKCSCVTYINIYITMSLLLNFNQFLYLKIMTIEIELLLKDLDVGFLFYNRVTI